MFVSYPAVYMTRGELVAGLKQLTDEYKLKSATEDEIREVLSLWKKMCIRDRPYLQSWISP